MKKVSVILINYNGSELTHACVDSILASINCEPKVIIVDNSSLESEFLKMSEIVQSYKNTEVELIRSTTNDGFSAGNNIGIKQAIADNAEYIMLLNNDTEIDEYMISHLLENSSDSSVAVPKIYYFSDKKKIWYAGGIIQWNMGKTKHLGENGYDTAETFRKKKVAFATGCCILIPTKIFKRIGLMDESFFMYGEDTELSFRLAENKIDIVYVPEAVMWHKIGASGGMQSPMGVYYGNRNRLYLMKKYRFPLSAWVYTYSSRILKGFVGVLTDTSDKYIIRALSDFHKNIRGKVDLK